MTCSIQKEIISGRALTTTTNWSEAVTGCEIKVRVIYKFEEKGIVNVQANIHVLIKLSFGDEKKQLRKEVTWKSVVLGVESRWLKTNTANSML